MWLAAGAFFIFNIKGKSKSFGPNYPYEKKKINLITLPNLYLK